LEQPPSDAAVPPEVLQAIYPKRHPVVQEDLPNRFAPNHQFTQLPTDNPVAETTISQPTRFNDSLMDTIGRNERVQSLPQNSAQIHGAPAGRDSNSFRQSLSDAAPGTPLPDSSPVEYEVVPASHTALADIRNLNPYEPTTARQTRVEPSINDESRLLSERDPINESSLPTELVYRGATLAELLDESNRENRGSKTRRDSTPAEISRDRSFTSNLTDADAQLSGDSFANGSLAETIQRISIALCIVLASACLLLLIAKRLFFGKRTSESARSGSARSSSKQRDEPSTIKLLTQLRLDNKSQLYLVQANEQPVLVAVDVAGIKSVVPLHADFGATLEEELAQPHSRLSIRSMAQDIEDDMEPSSDAGTYSAATFQANHPNRSRSNQQRPSPGRFPNSAERSEEVELEMKQKLAELLRGTLVNKQV
jgi:hypothetical protein